MTLAQSAEHCLQAFQLISSQGGWRSAAAACSPHTGSFNSHPHKEDDRRISVLPDWMHLSTHILTRRMTIWLSFICRIRIFQLTSSQGEWLYLPWLAFPFFIFQLTSSQGGWLVAYNMDRIRSSFQLTSSQGGWLYSLYFFITSINLSTHILTRRMTRYRLRLVPLFFSFNSHPHKEDDATHK